MNKKEDNIPRNPDQLKEKMLRKADEYRASDIHIDPLPDSYLIRFRIDGVLHTWAERPRKEHESLVSHLKVESGLDITEHIAPQGGRFEWKNLRSNKQADNRALDIRTSFFPTFAGEAVVMRLLNRASFLKNLPELFTDKNDLKQVNELIFKPYGMVLVAGPANSGKTTTLYSILKELSDESRNIVTLEDPVEYQLPLIRQSQVQGGEYTFAKGLRSILRQDPDIMMVGEIRDNVTAENALRAAMTGRLLFSTLHASNSTGAISRLLDMGLREDLVGYALSGIISQRLVRKICPNCKAEYTPDQSVLKSLGLKRGNTYIHGEGCEECASSGYQGRVGLFEILMIDKDIRRLITQEASPDRIRSTARKKQLKTLREDGIAKIEAGITTPEEVLRSTV